MMALASLTICRIRSEATRIFNSSDFPHELLSCKILIFLHRPTICQKFNHEKKYIHDILQLSLRLFKSFLVGFDLYSCVSFIAKNEKNGEKSEGAHFDQ